MRDSEINDLLIKRDFIIFHNVAGYKSIIYFINHAAAGGIYILHFTNNEHYVELAKNVAKRYLQHRKKHVDI